MAISRDNSYKIPVEGVKDVGRFDFEMRLKDQTASCLLTNPEEWLKASVEKIVSSPDPARLIEDLCDIKETLATSRGLGEKLVKAVGSFSRKSAEEFKGNNEVKHFLSKVFRLALDHTKY